MATLAPRSRGTTTVVNAGALALALGREVDGEVRFDPQARGAYSTDGSNYRQVPLGVVLPRSVDAGVAAVQTCRRFGAPITSRGGGTSLAGQTCNTGVIIDWSKHCNHVLSVDPTRRTCIVEPGIVLDDLNEQLRSVGLMFGPRPATHNHCTLGGMIGNNSCGSTAHAYGKTVDNVERLEILTYDGLRMWVGATSDDELTTLAGGQDRRAQVFGELRTLRDEYADLIRARFPQIPRRVSGYGIDGLLPEQGFHVARALVGSEGTLVTVLRAELNLVPVPAASSLLVLGFPDIAAAADAVPAITAHRPEQLEGLDHRLISQEQVMGEHAAALSRLPAGSGWLMVSFVGDSTSQADARARALVEELGRGPHPPSSTLVDVDPEEHALWDVREAGLGATAHAPGLPDTWDAAAPRSSKGTPDGRPCTSRRSSPARSGGRRALDRCPGPSPARPALPCQESAPRPTVKFVEPSAPDRPGESP